MTTEEQYPRPEPFEFDRTIGRKLKAEEARTRIAAYRRDEEGRNRKRGEYTESEFFGIDRILEIIRQNPAAVGIRFYYGINERDEDGPNVRRLTLVAVDGQGKDLFRGGDLRGLKDDGDDDTVGNGYTCPRHC